MKKLRYFGLPSTTAFAALLALSLAFLGCDNGTTTTPPINDFVAVTGISGVPTSATVGTPLALSGTVAPDTATNQTIVWSVKTAGTTGAAISGSSLTTTGAGTVTVTAAITNGLTASAILEPTEGDIYEDRYRYLCL
ncbi:hypothetical protein AGMMS50267_15930 [Spirochaetia bacterium]|nr:hypothetical protein AGMMS50267_15930 [Spirochaetia bacterium]